ncbi:MAG: NAD(P)H-dependent oxidoreductase [Gemella sp.]|nr:NAD(P)H-dependent oxidoreductase [Gemella sp.]
MTEEIRKEIRENFDRRVSVRVYNDKDVSKEDMETILDSAWLSPSSVGLEGWRFLVLDRAAIAKVRDELKPIAWGAAPQLDTASHFVLILAERNARYDSESIKESLVRRGLGEGDALTSRLDLYKSFQENDMKITDSERGLLDWTSKQTYIALGNMMTSAIRLGVDSCPIEGFNYDKVNEKLAELNLIDGEKESIAVMVSFGYRLADPKHQRSRKERNQVITWVK